MKKFLILFSFLLLISFSIAQPPFQSTTIINKGIEIEAPIMEYHPLNQNYSFYIHAHNASDGLLLKNDTTNCILHIYRPDNGKHIYEMNMSFDSNLVDFEGEISGGNFTETGQYAVLFYCEVEDEIGGFFEYGFEINANGRELSLWDALVRMFLILFFIGLIAGIHHITAKINFNKWNESILKKYSTKNYVKMVLSSLTYNLMKNIFIIYYLLGLPILMILANLTLLYGIDGLITFMNAILLIYTVGIMIVGLVFLSYVQEWLMNLIDMVRNLDWGIDSPKGGA